MSKEIKFSLYLSFLIIPFLIIFLIIGSVGIHLGEMVPPPLAAQQQYQADKMVVYRPDWRVRDQLELKWHGIQLREPDVMVIGSSLGYMFRSEFFVEQNAFYNASVGSMSPEEIAGFFDKLVEQNIQPRVVIINLDLHRFLSPAQPNRWTTDYSSIRYVYDHFRIAARRWGFDLEMLARDLEQFETDDLLYQGGIAIANQLGYRNDGSFFMGSIATRRERRLEINYVEIENRTSVFSIPDVINFDTLSTYRSILQTAAENDITVIGYISPFHTDALSTFERPEYTYINDVKPLFRDLFAEYDMPYYDFMRAAEIGGNDAELYDIRHAGEVLSLRMLKVMVTDNPELFTPYTNQAHIEQLLNKAVTDLLVIEPVE